jgi:hypothetical protein
MFPYEYRVIGAGVCPARPSREETMRLMLKFTIPVGKGNEAAADGTIGQAIERLVDAVNAEAAYFTLINGKRGGLIFFEESDPARLPAINEPVFATLDASIEIVPVLTLDDIKRGLSM